MKEQLMYLNSLLECLNSSDSSKSFSEIYRILEKYTKILNFVNSFNEPYKRASSFYYTRINSIRDNIQVSLYADTQNEKHSAFDEAKNELKKDIQALTTLIRLNQELVEIAI